MQVCDQLRTSFEPASVMEFGFNNNDYGDEDDGDDNEN